MIQKLKRSFVMINMTFILLILGSVFIIAYMSSYKDLVDESKDTLVKLVDSHIDSNTFHWEIGNPSDNKPQSSEHIMSARAFVVDTDSDGNIQEIYSDPRLDVSDTSLIEEMVSDCIASGKKAGVIQSANLRYLMKDMNTSIRIAFIDQMNEQHTLSALLRTFLLIGILALSAFFLISIYLSNRIVKPIEESIKKQRQFVADASHELKTPLTVILANLEIIETNKESSVLSQVKWFQSIKEETSQMTSLVSNLLYLAKTDSKAPTTHFSNCNASELLWSCYLPFEPIAYEADKTFDSEIEENLILQGDPRKLKELFNILIDNAIKYCAPHGRIFLSLNKSNEHILLHVKNTTETPIGEDDRERIFERFYRIDKSRSRDMGGFGLGLSIAKNIVEEHHGKITVTSDHINGTIFTVSLPYNHNTKSGTISSDETIKQYLAPIETETNHLKSKVTLWKERFFQKKN